MKDVIELTFKGAIQPLWDWRDRSTPVPSKITDIHGTHELNGVSFLSKAEEQQTRGFGKTLILTIESYQPIE